MNGYDQWKLDNPYDCGLPEFTCENCGHEYYAELDSPECPECKNSPYIPEYDD